MMKNIYLINWFDSSDNSNGVICATDNIGEFTKETRDSINAFLSNDDGIDTNGIDKAIDTLQEDGFVEFGDYTLTTEITIFYGSLSA